jgi:thymidine kinase
MKPLYVWTGPMGAAKSTGALHAARRYQRMGKKVALIRPAISVRQHEAKGVLVTKNGESFTAFEVDSAAEVAKAAAEAEVLWVDEPFLFDDEPILFDIIQALRKEKVVLISALGADAELRPFGRTMPRLLSVADEVIHCKADCDVCGGMNQATRTLICVDYTSGEKKVGGTESYSAACPACWTFLQTVEPAKRRQHFVHKGTPS